MEMAMKNQIKERPILFNGDMVRAILAGNKTQTRRVAPILLPNDKKFIHCATHEEWIAERIKQCPYGQVGDQLWVRETWGVVSHEFDENGVITDWQPNRPAAQIHEMPFGRGYYSGHVIYAADGSFEWIDDYGDEQKCWKPSIHMPRKASRIQLEITGVRVERLNDCSEADAVAEGIERVGGYASVSPWRNYRIGEAGEMSMHCSAPTRSYMTLWESINGAGSWAANPWVWVIEFKVIKP